MLISFAQPEENMFWSTIFHEKEKKWEGQAQELYTNFYHLKLLSFYTYKSQRMLIKSIFNSYMLSLQCMNYKIIDISFSHILIDNFNSSLTH